MYLRRVRGSDIKGSEKIDILPVCRSVGSPLLTLWQFPIWQKSMSITNMYMHINYSTSPRDHTVQFILVQAIGFSGEPYGQKCISKRTRYKHTAKKRRIRLFFVRRGIFFFLMLPRSLPCSFVFHLIPLPHLLLPLFPLPSLPRWGFFLLPPGAKETVEVSFSSSSDQPATRRSLAAQPVNSGFFSLLFFPKYILFVFISQSATTESQLWRKLDKLSLAAAGFKSPERKLAS